MKKKIVLYLILISVFALVGCSLKKSNSIIGTWKLDNIQNGPVTITFEKNNVLRYKSANYEKTGTYKIDGATIIFKDIWDEEEEYEYEIKNSKLTLDAVYVGSLSYIDMERVK